MQKLKNYIGGELLDPVGNAWIDNYEPATGKVYSLIPDSDEKDVALAVKAAKAAFKSWAATPVETRSRIIHKMPVLLNGIVFFL